MNDDSKNNKITVLTEYFHPEEASTAQLMTKLTTALTQQHNFNVDVITSYPNYHNSDQPLSVSKRETYNGVCIERILGTRFDKDSLLLRIVNWLTFTLLSLIRLVGGHDDEDAVLVLSNPPILPFVAWLNSKLRGTPYVYLIYDVYPDMAVELGYISENSLIVRLWDYLMRPVFRDADRVVVLGASMESCILEKFKDTTRFDANSVEIISNWEDGNFIKPLPKGSNDFAQKHDTVDKFTIVYSGNIGRFHELETVIDAIALLEKRGQDDIQLLIIGEGARKEKLQQRVEQRNIRNVRFLPFQPLDRLPETLTCGNASLVGIKPGMEGLCVSSKLYSSLAAGKPILAVVDEDDEVARVVREYDCGIHIEPGNADAAANTLQAWANNPKHAAQAGKNARECFEQQYTLRHAVDQYAVLFRDVITK